MTGDNTSKVPGFWRICLADAYLFKMSCVFMPMLVVLIAFDLVSGRQLDDCLLPVIFAAALGGVICVRWSSIAAVFKDHEELACRIADISSGTGLFGLQVFVSFADPCSDSGEQGCFLVKFNPRVKKLQKGGAITVLWNRKNMFLIKEAYCD